VPGFPNEPTRRARSTGHRVTPAASSSAPVCAACTTTTARSARGLDYLRGVRPDCPARGFWAAGV